MHTAPDRVELAAATVDEDAFTRAADGALIAQTSSRAIITTMLRELDVAPGDRILEIGTGSGYSTALLAELAGPDGYVTTLDVVPELTDRAGPLLRAQGYPNTRALTGDGAKGAPKHGPYDRIIAWTTPETIPQAWTAQAAPSAVLVCPVNITGLSKTYAVITAKISHGSAIAEDYFTRGSFVEMCDQVAAQWLIPPHSIDALRHAADATPWWLSAYWLRAEPPHAGSELVELLLKELHTAGPLLDEHEDPVGFYAWLLATRPDGLTTACLGAPTWQIGYSHESGGAFVPLVQAGPIQTAGDLSATEALADWARAWRAEGSPGWDLLYPLVTSRSDGELSVRAALKPTG